MGQTTYYVFIFLRHSKPGGNWTQDTLASLGTKLVALEKSDLEQMPDNEFIEATSHVLSSLRRKALEHDTLEVVTEITSKTFKE